MAEIIDILNEDGTLSGRVAEKAEIYNKGYWHRGANAWIINQNGEILIARRAYSKKSFLGMWDQSSSGHVDAGETSMQAIIRETREELGLSLSDDQFVLIGTWKEDVIYPNGWNAKIIHDVYVVREDFKISDIKPDPEEVAEVRYASIEWINEHTYDKDPDNSILGDEKWTMLLDYLKS